MRAGEDHVHADQARTLVPAPPGHPLFSALRAALEARGFPVGHDGIGEKYPLEAVVAVIVWDRAVRQALARELGCTRTEPGVVGDAIDTGGYDAATMLRMVWELERAVGSFPSGTDQGRWEHLLGRVGMLRAQVAELMTHPTYVVDASGAPDKRVQALGMAIDAHAGMTETAGDTVARAVEFHRFLLGVHEHPSTPKTVLAIEGQDHVGLRTRDGAIDCLAAAMLDCSPKAYPSLYEHAAALVDELLATDG